MTLALVTSHTRLGSASASSTIRQFRNAPDQIRTGLADWRQFGHRVAVVRNKDAIGWQIVHQRQAPLPELTDVHLLHDYILPMQERHSH
jgi:hypothetical protein